MFERVNIRLLRLAMSNAFRPCDLLLKGKKCYIVYCRAFESTLRRSPPAIPGGDRTCTATNAASIAEDPGVFPCLRAAVIQTTIQKSTKRTYALNMWAPAPYGEYFQCALMSLRAAGGGMGGEVLAAIIEHGL